MNNNIIKSEQLLTKILKQTTAMWNIKQYSSTLLILIFTLITSQQLCAQTPAGNQVSGTISSAQGEPLASVSVKEKGTSNGTATDAQGHFSIQVRTSNATLVISSVGFTSREVALQGRSTVSISLEPDPKALQAVVVVGYGVQSRRNLTGSIASVSGKDIDEVPLPSVDAMIQGRASGVQVTTASGAPGAGVQVKIRGNTSINAGNDPLYVIDGVPIRNQSFGEGITGPEGAPNPMADINPNDIASIEILKDASAAAIYGARAANGVVLITTKRGTRGATKFLFSNYTGIQQTPRQIPLLNGDQVKTFLLEAVTNAGGNLNNEQALMDDPKRSDYELYNNNTNWQNGVLQRALIQNYNLSMQGGESKTRYAFSLGYFDQEGVIIESRYKRFTSRFNLDYEVSKKLRIGNSISFTRAGGNRQYNKDAYETALQKLPYFPMYMQDSLGNDIPGLYFTGDWRGNPLPMARTLKNDTYTNRFIGNVYGEWDIIQGLTLRTSFGTDFSGYREKTFRPKSAIVNSFREASEQYTEDLSWLNENILTYNKSINDKHNVTALVGYTQQQTKWDRIRAAGRNAPSDLITTLNASAQIDAATSNISRWAINSLLSRFSYIYDDKYSIAASIRRDGSSRFGENNRYAVFPSVSGFWRASAEPFFEGIRALSDLKFRASWGKTGNQNIGDFLSRARYGVVGQYNGVAAISPLNFAVPDLSWETTTQFDAGLDVSFFNNRLTFVADYYIKNTTDLLVEVQLPTSSGFVTSLQNIGSTQNKGIELGVWAKIINKGPLTWDANFNISHNNNIVTKLPGGKDIIQFAWIYSGIAREGGQLGTFYAWKHLGVFSRDEDAYLTEVGKGANGVPLYDFVNNVPGSQPAKDANGNPKVLRNLSSGGVAFRGGDVIFQDINQDGVINNDDQQIIGRAQPKLFGGITNNFTFKGFDLNIFMQFQTGNDVVNAARRGLENMQDHTNQSIAINRRWRKQGDITDIPRAVYRDDIGNSRFSTRWIEDGSYFRMKTITLGYNFTQPLVKRAFTSARVYVTTQNLFTFTEYKGVDPEFTGGVIVGGIDWSTFPQPRTVTIGVNLGF
jgi:TonB-dependent starch-binding outer membrane protein SusC